MFCPLKDWADHHVTAFLQRKRIGRPLDPAFRSHGIGPSPECMHWLRKYWPEDYKRMLEMFPLAVAQADRWEAYLVSGKEGQVPVTPGSEPEAEL